MEPPAKPAPPTLVTPAPTPNAEPKLPIKPTPQGNPAFRAMGLPNWKLKLPSRNWTIFLTVIGSWTGALLYDRQMKKKEQQKWCTLVSHVAQESIPTNSLVRKITVYLAAPPGDGLRVAREHFTEYVKPVLVAGGLDWEVVEGRREGEVRAGLADRIRRLRRRKGELGQEPAEEDFDARLVVLRDRIGVADWNGQKGDVVIGRHTWKEYIRGLHEGWLGPLDAPKPPPAPITEELSSISPELISTPETTPASTSPQDDASPSSIPPTGTEPPKTPEPPKPEPAVPEKPPVTPAYISPASYSHASIPRTLPSELSASTPIPFPHILGFRNTPIRMYRYLTRRYVADDVGRQTAAIVLATYRPYTQSSSSSTSTESTAETYNHPSDSNTPSSSPGLTWEQKTLLSHEESEWWKKARQRKPEDGDKEREWLDDMVVDDRIAGRMRKFELEAEDEERARRIRGGTAGIPGRRAGVREEEETS